MSAYDFDIQINFKKIFIWCTNNSRKKIFKIKPLLAKSFVFDCHGNKVEGQGNILGKITNIRNIFLELRILELSHLMIYLW